VTLRLLAEVAWQPIGAAVAYGVWRMLEREGTGRIMEALGTGIALVALAWFPVAAIDLADRTRDDARLSDDQLAKAGVHSRAPVEAAARLRATIPAGDTYQLTAGRGRIVFWAHTSLLPRIAVGPGEGARWQIRWRRDPGDAGPAGATEVAPGVWVARSP
jgi:hypothetical protein